MSRRTKKANFSRRTEAKLGREAKAETGVIDVSDLLDRIPIFQAYSHKSLSPWPWTAVIGGTITVIS